MLKIIYRVSIEERLDEEAWLKAMLITPCSEIDFDFMHGVQIAKFGMIITPEQAVAVKLRRKIDLQIPWTGR